MGGCADYLEMRFHDRFDECAGNLGKSLMETMTVIRQVFGEESMD
jgi:hypothetical protein